MATSSTPSTAARAAASSIAVGAAVVVALAGPAYAARLDSAFPASALPRADSPRVDPPWHPVAGIEWRPVVLGADREFLQSFAEPGSGIVVRFIALYRLRVVGSALTNSENRVADDRQWRVAQHGNAELSLADQQVGVTSTQIVSGPHRRLVWSFYLVDGKIVRGPPEAKLLQARAVLLRRAPVAAFVAVAASMDDPDDRAAGQLARFLRATQPLPQYLDALPRSDAPRAGDSTTK